MLQLTVLTCKGLTITKFNLCRRRSCGAGAGAVKRFYQTSGGLKMSAYIVEKKTIDRIVTYLDRKYHGAENPNQTGQRLWNLNTKAVDQRYDEKIPVELYKFSPEPCGKVQLLKSLHCFLYQCSEGNVPESELYRDVDRLSNNLAVEIIDAMPEYQSSEWG